MATTDKKPLTVAQLRRLLAKFKYDAKVAFSASNRFGKDKAELHLSAVVEDANDIEDSTEHAHGKTVTLQFWES